MEKIGHIAERRDEVLRELHDMAAKHADERAGGLFEVLSLDPEKYPAQRFDCQKIDSEPADPGIVSLIGQAVDPKFPEFRKALAEHEESHGEVSWLGEMLENGQNIIIVTPHSDTRDIAEAMAVYYCELKERGYNFETSLVMGKILPFLGVQLGDDVTPATEILKSVCDHQYFSFPQTESMRNSKIDDGVKKGYNKLLRGRMAHQLAKGGNLFAIAPSGTTDKPLDGDPDTVMMAGVTHGTVELMTSEDSFVLPVAIFLKGDKSVLQPCDLPRKLRSEAEVHDVMRLISKTQSELTGKNFVYQDPRHVGRIATMAAKLFNVIRKQK